MTISYDGIENRLTTLRDDLKTAGPEAKRQALTSQTHGFDAYNLEEWIDETRRSDYITEDITHVGIATTLLYEKTNTFKDDHLDTVPWVGYAATVGRGVLNDQTITADKAFAYAHFKPGSAQNTTWKGKRQSERTIIEENALNNAIIQGDCQKSFHHATFKQDAAKQSTWFGSHNGSGATLPYDFTETIRSNQGTHNFYHATYE
jgi:hypothetical protein